MAMGISWVASARMMSSALLARLARFRAVSAARMPAMSAVILATGIGNHFVQRIGQGSSSGFQIIHLSYPLCLMTRQGRGKPFPPADDGRWTG